MERVIFIFIFNTLQQHTCHTVTIVTILILKVRTGTNSEPNSSTTHVQHGLSGKFEYKHICVGNGSAKYTSDHISPTKSLEACWLLFYKT